MWSFPVGDGQFLTVMVIWLCAKCKYFSVVIVVKCWGFFKENIFFMFFLTCDEKIARIGGIVIYLIFKKKLCWIIKKFFFWGVGIWGG